MPPEIVDLDAPMFAAVVGRDDMAHYLARVDGEDAAAAVLFFYGGDASTANASTIERFRRRGCQSALLARRLSDAFAAGSELVTTLTLFGSGSQRNMERAGFRMAYTKSLLAAVSEAEPPGRAWRPGGARVEV